MNVPARLMAFAALLAIVFGLAALAGRAVSPGAGPAPADMPQNHGAAAAHSRNAAVQLASATPRIQEISR